MLTLKPTVFIVEPDKAARASVEHMISRSGWTAATLGSAAMLLALPPLTAPSCLVVDVDLPELVGFDLLRRLTAERSETPIVAVANRSDIPLTVRTMKAGAVEFLTKPLADAALLPAIRYALARSRVVLDQLAELCELVARYESLSGREREVMARVVSGDLNKRIGAALGISEITVKAHRGNVMRKMRAESLPELVRMALRLEIAPVLAAAAGPARSADARHVAPRLARMGERPVHTVAVAG